MQKLGMLIGIAKIRDFMDFEFRIGFKFSRNSIYYFSNTINFLIKLKIRIIFAQLISFRLAAKRTKNNPRASETRVKRLYNTTREWIEP